MDLERIPDRIDAALAPVLGFVESMAARLFRFAILSVAAGVALVLGLTGNWLVEGGIRTVAALVVAAGALIPAGALALYRRQLRGAADDVAELILALRGWVDDEARAARVEALLAPADAVRQATTRVGKAKAAVHLFTELRSGLGDVSGLSAVTRRLTTTFGALGGITLGIGFGGTLFVAAAATGFVSIRVLLALT